MLCDTFLCHNLFFCSCSEIYFVAIDWSLRVSMENLSISGVKCVKWTNRRLGGKKCSIKKRAMTISYHVCRLFIDFRSISVKMVANFLQAKFFPVLQIASWSKFDYSFISRKCPSEDSFAAQYISPSSLEVVKQEFITIIYRDERKIFMEDPLKHEQRARSKKNLNKKFKLISIMSYLGTQFKNYNLH
jgi:hypothetical protein